MNSRDTARKSSNQSLNRTPRPRYWLYLLLIAVIMISYFLPSTIVNPEEISWIQFREQMLKPGDVEKLEVVNKEIAEVYINKERLGLEKYRDVAKNTLGRENQGPHYYFSIGSVEVFEKKLDDVQKSLPENEQVLVTYVTRKNWMTDIISWLLPLAFFGFLWWFLMKRIGSSAGAGGRGAFDFGRSNPQVFEKGKGKQVTFKDVAGYEEAKAEVMEVVEFLKRPEQFRRLGAKIPKGILLLGAPGTGKTLLAKAVAGEAGVLFFSLSGSEFMEMFVGVGPSRVRDLFNKAKQKAPSIVFIDEIDSIGRRRGKGVSIQANDERESTLNQLLAEMDGFDANTGVIVLAATNRPDMLDPALTRPGRFDRHIYLDLPDKKERLAIYKVHLQPLLLSEDVDPDFLAAQTPGFSGADIANVCNEAALTAARKKKSKVENSDFIAAIDRVVGGLEKKSRIISQTEKEWVAYHEAGHAIVSWMLKNTDTISKVSIIPRGKALGGAWYLPDERQIVTKTRFFEGLCVALGGRVAEEIVFNETSSGAMDDLEKVTKQAYAMVAHLGLSDKLGDVSFYDSTGMRENGFQKPYSEGTAQIIDDEVRKLIAEAHNKTKEILVVRRDKLDQLASLLLKKETVLKDEIEVLLGKKEK